jgi:O-antigen ligase
MLSIAAFLLITLPWLNPFSPGPTPAAVSLLFSWACAAALLGLYGGSHRFSGGRLVRVTAGAWLAAALLSALLGLLQYFGASAVFGVWVNSTALGEAYANLRQRNQFASLTSIGLFALLWWQAQGQTRRAGADSASRLNTVTLAPAATVAAAALLGAGNAVSSSRTGLMQLALLALLVLCWGGLRQPGVRRVLLAAGLAYVVATFALPWLAGLDPFTSGAWARLRAGDSACGSRLTLWGNVLHLIAQKPWLGWGWGELDYAHFITLYPGTRFCDILDNAHNLPLHLAVELGVPAALLVCGGALALAWRARPWRETDATRQMAWCSCCTACWNTRCGTARFRWRLGCASGCCGAGRTGLVGRVTRRRRPAARMHRLLSAMRVSGCQPPCYMRGWLCF